MLMKQIIKTDKAPEAIGTYSQAVKVKDTVYISGQIGLVPETMEMVTDDIAAEIKQVFANIAAICEAAGGDLSKIVKLTVLLTDLGNFALINEIMSTFFAQPYPARAAYEVAGLPKGGNVEIEAIMVLDGN
ncbi:MAG: RidA family protein [Gammaproteobacteria bacterium]|nr:MAG: RidA family protein [Gammaproteobacteria bacterium]